MKEKIDDYHRHEALDRTLMLAQTLAFWLLQHPFIDAHPEHGERIGKAVKLLYAVYNDIGQEHLK